MDFIAIIKAGVMLGIMGIIFGVLLAFASKKFAVEVDPRIPQVRDALPGANCGACGYPGCDGFATAVVEGRAPVNGCPVGGQNTLTMVSKIMGAGEVSAKKMVARVICSGDNEKCKNKFEYHGLKNCLAASALSDGPKACGYGCMGLGSCVDVCMFDAIHINEFGVAVVDKEKCTACNKCIEICPKKVISLIPYSQLTVVNCNNKEIGGQVKKNCSVACIACRLCEKNCPKDAIHVVDNIAVIDAEKCINCGICVMKCPTKAIHTSKKLPKPKPKPKPTEKSPEKSVVESTEKQSINELENAH